MSFIYIRAYTCAHLRTHTATSPHINITTSTCMCVCLSYFDVGRIHALLESHLHSMIALASLPSPTYPAYSSFVPLPHRLTRVRVQFRSSGDANSMFGIRVFSKFDSRKKPDTRLLLSPTQDARPLLRTPFSLQASTMKVIKSVKEITYPEDGTSRIDGASMLWCLHHVIALK